MERIDEILSKFSDTELAYLNKYQLDSYLLETQTKIKDYIFVKRGLTQSTLDELIVKNKDKKLLSDLDYCPRCKSDKIRTDKVEWIIPLHRSGLEDEYAMLHEIHTGMNYLKDKLTCNVCGYILFDPNNEKRSVYKKLKDFFCDNPIWSWIQRE